MPVLSRRRLTAGLAVSVLTLTTLTACGTPESVNDKTANADNEACAPDLAKLEFGLISAESENKLKSVWEPLLEEMSEALERPVVGFYAPDYASVTEAMGTSKVQVAWFGGKSYIEAAERAGAEAFAQTVALDGTKGYYSHLITNKDNAIAAEVDLGAGNGDQYVVENAAELTFAFNDPGSTSGFLVPTYYIFAQQGVNAEKIFSELIYMGSHEATALAVAENQVDVATNNSENLDRLKVAAPEALEKLQIIWTSPIIPSDPLAYHQELPDCLKESIQTFFFNYDNEAVLTGLQWSGLDPASDEDWDTIRELQIAKDILEVQNDGTFSETAKKAKLAELEAKLEALN
ncbi:MAG: phosphonate ABC transporter substrate-binding protein [Spirulina sp. SIO3F2]|nr:phosphonate ABC transporter substrate-binding protein [Spirulina sp. SIO3F2]